MGQKLENQILHKKQSKNMIFTFFATTKIQKSLFFHGFWLKMNPDTPKKIHFFHFLHLYKQKIKKIMIFGEVPFFQFRVHLDPFFIKKSRFRTHQQEKLVTKVILLSLSWTKLGWAVQEKCLWLVAQIQECKRNLEMWWHQGRM